MTHPLSDWTIVFDLDGTLLESAPDLHAALNYTLSTKSLAALPLETIRSMIGDGAKALIRKGLVENNCEIDETEIDGDLWPTFLDHYRANITENSFLFEGALECLERLHSQNIRMAVCTNKAESLARQIISELNLDKYFQSLLGGDSLPIRKPDGEHIRKTIEAAGGHAERSIMVGDSQTDERAARNAALPFVFVTFGYGARTDIAFPKSINIDHWSMMETALIAVSQRT